MFFFAKLNEAKVEMARFIALDLFAKVRAKRVVKSDKSTAKRLISCQFFV